MGGWRRGGSSSGDDSQGQMVGIKTTQPAPRKTTTIKARNEMGCGRTVQKTEANVSRRPVAHLTEKGGR